MQLSEIQFFFDGQQIDPLTATVTSSSTNYPAGEAPEFASDGDYGTKWLNFDYTPGTALIFQFPSSTSVDSYNYVTGGDAPERDPVSWRLEGSLDGTNWDVLDVITKFGANPNRNIEAKSTPFELPESPPPVIELFEFFNFDQSVIVEDGTDFEFFALTSYADDVTLTYPGGSPINVEDSSEGAYILIDALPTSDDTTFTLNATAAGMTKSADLTVRSVAGGEVSYQLVRFTPIELRTGGGTIQLEDFRFMNGSVEVEPIAVSDPGGTNLPGAAEGVEKLIDDHDYNNYPPSDPATTKWLSGVLSPIVFDFGTTATFDSYSFVTGNDFPDRDPVKWIMEGSSDGGTTWELFENVTSIKFNSPLERDQSTTLIPLPGTSLKPAVLSFAGSGKLSLPGDTITLSWDVIGSDTVAIEPGLGIFPATGGSVDVTPTEDTTYTLTTTAPGGGTSISSLSVHVIENPSDVINYPDFEDADDISLVGNAQIINDSFQFPLGGDVKRLRLTSFTNGVQGSAWRFNPIPVADGFVTEFDAEPANPNYANGADGMAFTIQNTPEGAVASPGGELFFLNSSLSVVLDSYPNAAGQSFARVEVRRNGELLTEVNLVALGLAKGGAYLTIPTTYGEPYHVRIAYAPGDLDVFIDGTQIITDLDVDLADELTNAVDAEGKAYLGFSARTGGLAQYHDIVNWTLTPGSAVSSPLALLNHAFDLNAGTLQLTWASTADASYIITTSPDLASAWTSLTPTPVAGLAGQTTTTVDIPAGTKGFFRVEESD